MWHRLKLELLAVGIFAVVIVGLSSVGYFYALQFDWGLRIRHLTMISCDDITNAYAAIFIFLGIFFGYVALMTTGEVMLWLEAKKKGRRHSSSLVLIHGGLALTIGGIGSWILRSLC